MKSVNKSLSANNSSAESNLEPVFLGKISALPEKFSIVPYECISLIWLDETIDNPIRGNHRKSKIKPSIKERFN